MKRPGCRAGGDWQRRRQSVFARDSYRCLWCNSLDDLTVDHVVPRSQGGSNRIDNLQTLCFDCNQFKRDRDFTDVERRAA